VNADVMFAAKEWGASASIFISGSRSTPKSLCSALRRFAPGVKSVLRGAKLDEAKSGVFVC
jgi:hypothetical protein